jgi:hypothetical protein
VLEPLSKAIVLEPLSSQTTIFQIGFAFHSWTGDIKKQNLDQW